MIFQYKLTELVFNRGERTASAPDIVARCSLEYDGNQCVHHNVHLATLANASARAHTN